MPPTTSRPRPVQFMTMVMLGLAMSCGSEPEKPRVCEGVACGDWEVPIHPEDNVVNFVDSSFAHLETEDDEVTVAATGQVIFRLEEPDCVVTLTSGCPVSVSLLRVDLADFVLDTPEGAVTFQSVSSLIVSDDDLTDEGLGAYLPPGDEVTTCGLASEHPFATTSETNGLTLTYDVSTESLAVIGELGLTLDQGDPGCSPLETKVWLTLGGEKPWVQGGE